MVSIILTLALLPVIIFCLLYIALKLVQFFTFKPKVSGFSFNKEVVDQNEKKTIKMLQYNVFWRPWLLHLGVVEFVRERARFLSERLDDYDVICLNESFHFGSNVADEFMETMKSKKFVSIATSRRVPIFSKFIIDSGVMILSKYPIVETDDVTYRDGCSFDGFAAKGCVYAKIQISESQHINIFATHLQASYSAVKAIDYNVRVNQVKDINNLMRKHILTDTAPAFLLGDMNIDFYRTREYNQMMSGLQIPNYDVVDVLRKGDDRPITIAIETDGKTEEQMLTLKYDMNLPKSIDYVFTFEHKNSPSIKSCEANVEQMKIQGKPYSQLSDHCAVSCNVVFK